MPGALTRFHFPEMLVLLVILLDCERDGLLFAQLIYFTSRRMFCSAKCCALYGFEHIVCVSRFHSCRACSVLHYASVPVHHKAWALLRRALCLLYGLLRLVDKLLARAL